MNEFIAISVADFEAPYGSTPPKNRPLYILP